MSLKTEHNHERKPNEVRPWGECPACDRNHAHVWVAVHYQDGVKTMCFRCGKEKGVRT